MTFQHTILAHMKDGWARHKKTILITAGSTGAVILIIVGGSFAYVKTYEGRIYPNVSIGSIDVSGMTQAEASETLQATMSSMLDRGLPIRFTEGETNELAVIDLRVGETADPDFAFDLINLNVDQATQEATTQGRRTGNPFIDTFESLLLVAKPHIIQPAFTVANVQIEASILEEFGEYEEPGEATKFDVTKTRTGYDVTVTEGTAGRKFVITDVLGSLADELPAFSITEKHLQLKTVDDIILSDEAANLEDALVASLEAAPYTLTFTSEKQIDYSWKLEEDDLIDWMIPVRNPDGDLELALNKEQMADFLDDVRNEINVAPQNARFTMEGDRVVEFAGSLNGVSFDADSTLSALATALGEEGVELAIVVEIVEPDITTESVNSLGIQEIVGVGTSNFGGSPSNRISNIKHGAAKLNGLLIAPGEEFSLLEALKPFTVADGWLPELVIKGDEITPEVGGGACQFGTTLFRAAMLTGLEITQRRNHSLVVSYYGDPQNGNPGSDATIYDPAPDFRFRNDMENYLLLTTEVNMETKDMIFTFWGTSDGRKANYTPPEILSWTGYGATITKETESLPKGVRQCQAPHSGAVTTFDYNVEYADGTTFAHTYTSTYRSLPQVCLVGIGGGSSEPAPEPEPEPAEDPGEEVEET